MKKWQEPNNDPRNAKYIVYDPHVDETYLCPTEEDALAIAQNALESNWPDEDKGIYIAAITVTPTHKAVIADEWEEDGHQYCDFGIQKTVENQP